MTMNYSIDVLKEMLQTRMSEYEMLNKTLVEMMERGINEDNIMDVENEINETLDNIEMIKKWIEYSTEKNNKDISKPKFAKSVKMSLYDNVKKNEEKNKELNYGDVYMETYNQDMKVVKRNQFLVRLNGVLNINEWMVKSVAFDKDSTKRLMITIQDHLVEKDGKKYPIISEIRDKVYPHHSLPFSFKIDYLDNVGNVIYTERYHGCKIVEVSRGSVGYDTDELETISFTVSYNEITYETAN